MGEKVKFTCYVFCHSFHARGTVHVVNVLNLNRMESFILLVFFTQIKKSWATYPLLHTEYSAPRTLPNTCEEACRRHVKL